MLGVSDAFNKFHSRIIPSDSILAKAKQHCDYIKQVFNNDRYLAPKKFYYSGSYGKNTHISPLEDVDLSPHYDIEKCLKRDGEFYTPAHILGLFKNRLDQTYGSRLYVRKQRRSIGLFFTDMRVELVPVFWDGNREYDSYIPDRESKYWMRTSIPKHLQVLRGRDKSYRPYGKTIRFMKVWKEKNNLPLKGFALELIVLKALDNYGTSTDLGLNFHNVMEYLHNERFDEVIWLNDYYSSHDIDIPSSPMMVIDPVNPANNITEKVTVRKRNRIMKRVDISYKQSKTALKQDEKGETMKARANWELIFGPQFP